MRSVTVRILAAVIAFLGLPAAALAQEAEHDTFMSVLFTWAPVLLVVALWLFFMLKMGMGGKGPKSYRAYMEASKEKMTEIEVHLGSISKSLAELTEILRSRERLP